MSRAHKVLALIVAVGIAAAGYAAVLRWRVEMPNRAVAVIVDWLEVQQLAATSGIEAPVALRRLRAAGATDVAISEEHLSDLLPGGEVTVLPAASLGLYPGGASPRGDSPLEGVVLSAYDTATAQRLRAHLSAKLPAGTVPAFGTMYGQGMPCPYPGAGGQSTRGFTPSAPDLSPLLIAVRAPQAYLETVGLGWPPQYPMMVTDAGLGVVARLDNYPGMPRKAIAFMVAEAYVAGASLVIFTRDQVLGYPGFIQETAEALQAGGIRYGSVELARQLGDQGLGRALDGDLVRVHSITEAEMPTLAPAVAIARYTRAVRERGIRACYVRLFLGPRAGLLEFNLRYLASLKRALAEAGYRRGAPRPFASPGVPLWAVMLMGAGAVAAAVLALGMFVVLAREWWHYALLILGVAGGGALLWFAPHMMRAEKALLAAIAFPSIGLIAVARGARTTRAAPGVTPAGLAARCGGWLIGASMISLAGGIVVAGLLTERLYMSKVLQFMGVKLALGLPVMVVGAVWVLGLYAAGQYGQGMPCPYPAYRRRVQENFQRVWNRPVCVWEAAVAALLAAAAVVVLMRSGNQPAVEVSGFELRARELLERVLLARPRTKEFLVGHPALMLAMAMALRGRTRWVLLFLLLGAVGQVSLLNTFCHVHTPLLISLVRAANGLWLGLAIGAIAVWVWDRLWGARAQRPGQQTGRQV